MKIYTRDYNWAGCDIVIAESREEAARIIIESGNNRDCYTLETLDELAALLQEQEIKSGWIYYNLGDQ